MPSPAVSIVLPVHNGARYLSESIESCLRQTYRDFELIAVNDGSTDETPQIIEKFSSADSRVRGLHNEKNLNLPASLNRGFAAAKGNYYSWTSDDNLYHPDAIGNMLHVLQSQTDIDISFANYVNIDASGQERGKYQHPSSGYSAGGALTACFLYKRKVHEKLGGYSEDLFGLEDVDFWMRASRYFTIRLLNETLYSYRFHEESLSAKLDGSPRLKIFEKIVAKNQALLTLEERAKLHWAMAAMSFEYACPRRHSLKHALSAIRTLHGFPYRGRYRLLAKLLIGKKPAAGKKYLKMINDWNKSQS